MSIDMLVAKAIPAERESKRVELGWIMDSRKLDDPLLVLGGECYLGYSLANRLAAREE